MIFFLAAARGLCIRTALASAARTMPLCGNKDDDNDSGVDDPFALALLR